MLKRKIFSIKDSTVICFPFIRKYFDFFGRRVTFIACCYIRFNFLCSEIFNLYRGRVKVINIALTIDFWTCRDYRYKRSLITKFPLAKLLTLNVPSKYALNFCEVHLLIVYCVKRESSPFLFFLIDSPFYLIKFSFWLFECVSLPNR